MHINGVVERAIAHPKQACGLQADGEGKTTHGTRGAVSLVAPPQVACHVPLFHSGYRIWAHWADPFDLAIGRRIDELDDDFVLGWYLWKICSEGVVLAACFTGVDHDIVDVNSDLTCVARRSGLMLPSVHGESFRAVG